MKSWITSSGVEILRILAGRSNVWLVRNEHLAFLVDSSVRYERARLLRRIRETCGYRNPEYLVLTHTHFDHAANAACLRETLGLKIAVHESEAAFLEDGFSPVKDLLPRLLAPLGRIKKEKVRLVIGTTPLKADILVKDRLELSGLGIPVIIRHMPGHTGGSVTVIVDNEIAIVGDNMVNITWQKVFPPFYEDYSVLMASWKELLDGPCRLFLPSHGQAIPRALLERAYFKQDSRI